MARPEKEAVVEEVAEILVKAKGVFVTDFQGLNVEAMMDLRRKCREASVGYYVVKNTLARLAASKVGRDEMVNYLEGPSAIAYSYDDPSAPARVISEFSRKTEKPTIKMSLFEGVFYGPESVELIASLPTKEVLYTRMVGGFQTPIRGLVGSLNGLLQKAVMTLNAVKEALEKKQ
ncbi:MAG: 50S ribosomal protein L10 [bacterium]